MKMLIVHNDYQQSGGEQVAVSAQLALLNARGHRVIHYIKDSATINQYGLWQKFAFLPRTVFSWETYRHVRALAKRERPDLAHIHNVFPLISPSVYWALSDVGVPIVQTIHNFRFMCPNALFYTRGQICERCKFGNTLHAIRWKCFRHSYPLSALYALTVGLHYHWGTFQMIDHWVALTEFVAKKLLESGLTTRDKISVLGNFLADPLPQPGSFDHREPYVIYLGRLSPEKGVTTLMEAIVGLPPLKLKILGDGPQAEALHRFARQKEMSHVEFLGRVVGEKKWDLIRQARATVVPSVWYESFPLVVLESFALGTPVVASNLGSIPYIVEDNISGLLFAPGDWQDLREKLAWLLAHSGEGLAMGRHGRSVVEEHYSASSHYEKLMTIYSAIK